MALEGAGDSPAIPGGDGDDVIVLDRCDSSMPWTNSHEAPELPGEGHGDDLTVDLQAAGGEVIQQLLSVCCVLHLHQHLEAVVERGAWEEEN